MRPVPWLALAFPVVLALSGADSAAEGVTVRDDRGRVLRLAAPAQRIVSLAPHLTDILDMVGASERLVGAIGGRSNRVGVPEVGRPGGLDLERIVALEPDLILAWGSGNPAGQVALLEELGLKVYISEPRTLADVAETVRRLGTLTARKPEAETIAARFEQRIAALTAQYADRTPVPTFYQLWSEPLMTVGGRHLISSVISRCGGRNVFADLPAPAARVGREAVMAANPRAIVISASADSEAARDRWRPWSGVAAVKADHVYVVDDALQRHSPRLLKAMAQLCAQLQRVRERAQEPGDQRTPMNTERGVVLNPDASS